MTRGQQNLFSVAFARGDDVCSGERFDVLARRLIMSHGGAAGVASADRLTRLPNDRWSKTAGAVGPPNGVLPDDHSRTDCFSRRSQGAIAERIDHTRRGD